MTTLEIVTTVLIIASVYLLGVLKAYKMFVDYFYNWIASVAEEDEIRSMMKQSLFSWSLVIVLYLKNRANEMEL